MRIGVLSDSHDHLDNLKRGIDFLRKRKVEGWIHLGDYVAPFSARLLKDLPGIRYFLLGNNDGEKLGLAKELGELSPGPMEIHLQGRKIFLMHEPYCLDPILSSGRYDIVLYGHTHKVDCRKIGGTLLLNPGEVCGWSTGLPTVAIIDLDPLFGEVFTVFGDPVPLL